MKSETARNWIDTGGRIMIPIILFVLGVQFKDSFERSMKERTLEVSSAKSMQELLAILHREQLNPAEGDAAALALSAYGEAAIVPLIGAIEFGTAQVERPVRRALFMIGLVHPEGVSRELGAILAVRSGQLRFRTHKMAIEVLGRIGHPSALPHLQDYQAIVNKPASEGVPLWSKMVENASVESYRAVQAKLAVALAQYGITWEPPR